MLEKNAVCAFGGCLDIVFGDFGPKWKMLHLFFQAHDLVHVAALGVDVEREQRRHISHHITRIMQCDIIDI